MKLRWKAEAAELAVADGGSPVAAAARRFSIPVDRCTLVHRGKRYKSTDPADVLAALLGATGTILVLGTREADQLDTPEARRAARIAEDATLTVKIKERDGGDETVFKVKATTPLGKLFNSYGQRTGKARDSFLFSYRGRTIRDDDTQLDFTSPEMEDGAQIDCFRIGP